MFPHPFHNIKRLCRIRHGSVANVPDGDCFTLATYAACMHKGQIKFCVFKETGDLHAILETRDGYYDYTSRHFFTAKSSPYYFKYFEPSSYGLSDYLDKHRKSSLDGSLCVRFWENVHTYVQINGNQLSINGVVKENLNHPSDVDNIIRKAGIVLPVELLFDTDVFKPNPLFV